jgi:endoglucanase
MDKNYNIDKEWMDRVQEVVDYAMGEGLYIILDLHHENLYLNTMITKLDYAGAKSEITKVWKQIATRFKDYPERLMFDVLNEPHGLYDWFGTVDMHYLLNKLNADALAVIRKSGGNNGKRCVLLPTFGASWTTAEDYVHPPNDPYAIVSIHAYEPYYFALDHTSALQTDKFTEPEKIKMAFDALDKYFISKGIPVILGEMGAYDKNNLPERVKWAKAFSAASAKLHIPVLLWDEGLSYSSGLSFFERQKLIWKFPTIIDALFKPYGGK